MELVDRQSFVLGLAYTLNRRKGLMTVIFLFVFFLFLFAGYLITPTWEAEALLMVEAAPRPVLAPFPEATVGGSSGAADATENLAVMLGSQGMAHDIVKQFGLDERLRLKAQEPKTFRDKAKIAVVKTIMSPLLLMQAVGILPKGEVDWVDKAAEDFREGLLSWLSVESLPDSQVVSLKINGETPQLATDIANAMIALARTRLAEASARGSENSLAAHRAELDKARTRLQKAEAALQAFQEERQGVRLDEESRSKSLLLGDLTAQARRLAVEIGLLERGLAAAGDTDAVESVNSSTVSADDSVRQLRAMLNAKVVELARLRTERTETHPDVQTLQSEITRLRGALRDAIGAVVSGIKTDRARLEGEIESLQRALLALPAQELMLAELNMAVELYRGVYRELLASTEQLEILANSGMAAIDFTVLDNAYVSPLASSDSPSWLIILVVGVVIAAGTAVGLALFVEYWRDPVKSPIDLQRQGIEVLAVIPRVSPRL